MGLDMFLFLAKEEYKSDCFTEPKDTDLKLEYPKGMEAIEEMISKRATRSVERSIQYKVGYWRKANAIHKWFVDNYADGVDNCQPIRCNVHALENLLKICAKIKVLPESAPEELPTEGGFFFGSTEYDEWYYKDIDETIEMLQPIIAFIEQQEKELGYDAWVVIYQASW